MKITLNKKEIQKILKEENFKKYKNKNKNKMDEFTNNILIISCGKSLENNNEGYDIFRIRDFDISNGKSKHPQSLEDFKNLLIKM